MALDHTMDLDTPVSPPSFCSTPLPKMPKMTVAERLRMLRKMRQASLDKESESVPVVAAEPESCKLPEVHDQKVENEAVENNAVDGPDSLRLSPAGGTPHAHMLTSDEATRPPTREEAPRDCVESPSWDLQRKISRQIEYYFGDYNLPRDKFMLDLMVEDEGRSINPELLSTSCLFESKCY